MCPMLHVPRQGFKRVHADHIDQSLESIVQHMDGDKLEVCLGQIDRSLDKLGIS